MSPLNQAAKQAHQAGGCPPPPPPEALGALESRLRDLPRIAWWGVKAQRFSPIIMALSVTILALSTVAIGVATNWHPWLTLAGGGVILGSLVAVAELVSLATWVWIHSDTRQQIYMGQTRTAVIVLRASRRELRWEINNHITQHTGKKLGADLRQTMSTTLLATATAAHVGLYGKAANRKVQKLYLEQFEAWGLRPDGRRAVVWP